MSFAATEVLNMPRIFIFARYVEDLNLKLKWIIMYTKQILTFMNWNEEIRYLQYSTRYYHMISIFLNLNFRYNFTRSKKSLIKCIAWETIINNGFVLTEHTAISFWFVPPFHKYVIHWQPSQSNCKPNNWNKRTGSINNSTVFLKNI